ncbi:MAG: hypothetical protein E6590_13340, partial [Clostridiales bacterium]|nr:hypothetical protein [Clostridiales bacterium]
KKRAPRPGAPKRDVCGRMEESRVGITLAYWISWLLRYGILCLSIVNNMRIEKVTNSRNILKN